MPVKESNILSKITTWHMYDHLRSKCLNTLPNIGWNAVRVRRYEEPYHPTSSRELNCSVIFGTAVAGRPTIVNFAKAKRGGRKKKKGEERRVKEEGSKNKKKKSQEETDQ